MVAREGVDTLLAQLLSRLQMRQPLEDLVSGSNEVVLDSVEAGLRGHGDLHALALLLAGHSRAREALEIWKVGCLTPFCAIATTCSGKGTACPAA